MNKKPIITALLALVAMAGQAQTKNTAIVKGYSPALEDSIRHRLRWTLHA